MMVIGTAKVAIHIPESRSLKSKRKVVSSLKQKLKNRFNVAVAEVEDHDAHQRAVLGVVVVSADQPHADRQLQALLGYIEENALTLDVAIEFSHR